MVDAVFSVRGTVDEPTEHLALEFLGIVVVAVEVFLAGRENQTRYLRYAHCLRFVVLPVGQKLSNCKFTPNFCNQ